MVSDEVIYDLFVIGGGVNGVAIARDAAGRGLRVGLAERGDIAGETSSKSTKLFHGGLRYLEFFEFKLVRHSLIEREILLRNMPHIAWPMRFILPIDPMMRFVGGTPVSKLLGVTMPWLKGRRPAWVIRAGLALYDALGGREILPPTSKIRLQTSPLGAPLKPRFDLAYEYSDVWVEDSRLSVLMARDAAARGANIMVRNAVTTVTRYDDHWVVETEQGRFSAKILVNAAGPWVEQILRDRAGQTPPAGIRLVRGSHIITKKRFDHDRTYFFQGDDGRIVFAIPYEDGDFTLIGTTEAAHDTPDLPPEASEDEINYLINFVNKYFELPLEREDVVWTYSGVRPLYDDGAASATAATRDYILALEEEGGAPSLSIFGGKITTHRFLANEALAKLGGHLDISAEWTHDAPLPGGDFAVDERDALIAQLQHDYDFLDEKWARRLIKAYGRNAWEILGDAKGAQDLGQDLGASLSAREVDYLIAHEFARTGEDVLWRRSKLGLRLSDNERQAVDNYVAANLGETQ